MARWCRCRICRGPICRPCRSAASEVLLGLLTAGVVALHVAVAQRRTGPPQDHLLNLTLAAMLPLLIAVLSARRSTTHSPFHFCDPPMTVLAGTALRGE